MFGNTEEIARAVADGVSAHLPVEACEVGNAPDHFGDDVGLLLVGAPTHAFSLSRPSTREDAARQAASAGRELVSTHDGVREWLDRLQESPALVATFDTHTVVPLPGTASRAAERRLRHLGFVVLEHESFHVTGGQGPLAAGELERARRWGETLSTSVIGSVPVPAVEKFSLHRPVMG
jgi:hypothetical protein